MPIGKNAIKRVENNGYSNVKTAAPDMENSTVIANISKEVVEKMVKPVEEKAKAKKAPAKKAEVKKAEPVKACAKAPAKKAPAKKPAVKKAEKMGFERVSVGNDMPYYLL